MAIVVVWGQSNARSAGTTGLDVPPSLQSLVGVSIWNTFTQSIEPYVAGVNSDTFSMADRYPQKWGPEAEFARLHREEHPGDPVHILKCALGGTKLGSTVGRNWRPSLNELFLETTVHLNTLKAALGGTSVVSAVLGMQGEGDAAYGYLADQYEANKIEFYAAARQQWGDENTRFVDGRISINAIGLPYAATVRAAQLSAADSEMNAHLVTTDDLPLGAGGLHFTAEGVVALGNRMFHAYARIAASD